MLNLEKFVIARYSSTGARNAAFSQVSPSTGQVIYVASLNEFQVWDGSQWVEFGVFTGTREFCAVTTEDQTRQSILFGNIVGLSVPVSPGIWKVSVDLIYRGENGNYLRPNFSFPGPDSRITIGGIARSETATGSANNTTVVTIDATYNRLSGGVDDIRFGTRTLSESLYAHMGGTLFCTASGTLQMQFARGGAAGSTVRIDKGSVMTAKRVGPLP